MIKVYTFTDEVKDIDDKLTLRSISKSLTNDNKSLCKGDIIKLNDNSYIVSERIIIPYQYDTDIHIYIKEEE